MGIVDRDEAWNLSKELIQNSHDHSMAYLGAQILYQKIERDLEGIPDDMKSHLNAFLFEQIEKTTYFLPIVDKLCSSAALIGCSLVLFKWKTLLDDVISFMQKSK